MLLTIKMLCSQIRNKIEKKVFSRKQNIYMKDMSFSEAFKAFPSRNDLHAYMHHYSYQILDEDLQRHRRYFSLESRGFGEDAFHAMWFILFRDFKPTNVLEIGVYRGQVLSLWALLANKLGFNCDVHGISPFTSAGDDESSYIEDIDYYDDVLKHHTYFGLKSPSLFKGFSNDPGGVDYIKKRSWDLIYIDGGHDYEVVRHDYLICRDRLSENGILVIDDSSLYTDFNPPRFSFAGHPGPSQVMKDLAMNELTFLGGVGHNNVFIKKSES